MRQSLDRYGARFAQRVLANPELALFERNINKANFLAKRFAAKEAMAKALGTGFRNGLHLRQIIVSNDELGKPSIECVAHAERLIKELGIGHMHVSLSDERDYAVAFVVLESAH
jgi:holo-[acyl-carrier protein] synthase